MKRPLTEPELEKISAHIATQMGLHFPPAKWRNLEKSLRTAAGELGFANVQECITRVTTTPQSKEFINSLAPYLTIGETYFLREIESFEILEKQIIPGIIEKRRGGNKRLRIWSAGCATGEEAYSIAILLDKMRDTLHDWKISILATDINPLALDKAREGLYTNWSFRKTPSDFRANYFRETEGGLYALLPRIKEMVTFSSFNLVEALTVPPSPIIEAIDVIFCRNVLMYFSPPHAGMVVERFHRCLQDEGTLFVSPCETNNILFAGFAPIHVNGATFYQKKESAVKPIGIELKLFTPPSRPAPAFPTYPVQEILPAPAPPLAPKATVDSPPPLFENHNETATYQEALTFYEQGAYREAAAKVFSQLKKNKNNTRAIILLCRIYANEGRLSEALTLSDQALATGLLSAELHYLRAVILQEQGRDDESAASFKKALYLKKDLILAHFSLAKIEQHKGKNRESQIHFNNALSLLDRYHPDEVIPESDGMLAGQLKELIQVTAARK